MLYLAFRSSKATFGLLGVTRNNRLLKLNLKRFYLAPTKDINQRKFSTTNSVDSTNNNKFTLNGPIENHLVSLARKYEFLGRKLSSGEEMSPEELAALGKEYSELGPLMSLVEQRESAKNSLKDLSAMEAEESSKGNDEEMIKLVRSERSEIEVKLLEIEASIIGLLTPKDKDDERDIILEVRAGTGGAEASLFASEIFRMYQKYSFLMGWKWEELSLSKSDIGGFKEATAQIRGTSVYKVLKFESGVHRVQRIPINDTKIQTSAASVIVLPEVGELDLDIRPQDLKIDVFRSGGAGGQSVNKTESAVRMTHIPTGITVSMQDERSQIQNRARALKYLRAKLYDYEKSKAQSAMHEMRTAAHGTGDRSDKIRTYNFPQDRVTDHRASVTISGIARMLAGEILSSISSKLVELDEKERISNFLSKLVSGK